MAGDLMDEQYNDRFILRGDLSQHIEPLIQEWALLHSRQEISDWGQAHHHPWGPAARPDELLGNDQLWDRGYYVNVEDIGEGVSMDYPGAPYRMTQSHWRLRHLAPQAGQHNREIYLEELGLSSRGLEALAERGVI